MRIALQRILTSWRHAALIAAAAALLALGLAACGGDDDSGKAATAPPNSAAASSPAAANQPTKTGTVKIGLIISQSGAAAASVGPGLDAVELAVKQINEKGFVVGDTKYTFDLTIVDDKSDPNSAVAAGTQLADDKGVKFIFGPVTSTLAPPVAQLLLPKKVLMMSPASALDSLLSADQIKGSSKTLFKTNYSSDGFPAIYGAGVKALFPNAKTAAVLFPADQTGASTAKYYADGVTALGLQVVANETFPATSADFSTVLTKIKGANPDVIIMGYLLQQITGIAKQAEELGIKAGLVAGSSGLSIAISGATGKPLVADYGAIYQPVVLETIPSGEVITNRAGVKKYVDDLQSVLGRKAGPGAQTGFYFYDWVFLLRDAMVKSGSVSDTAKASDALEAAELEGAIGKVKFAKHASGADADVCKVSNGKVSCQTITNPVK